MHRPAPTYHAQSVHDRDQPGAPARRTRAAAIDRPILSRDELLGGLPARRAPTLLRLLSRAAESIGAVRDPAEIGPTMLREAAGVLRVEAAFLAPSGAAIGAPVQPAQLGAPDVVHHLRAAVGHVVERVEASGMAAPARVGDGEPRPVLVAPLATAGRVLGGVVLARAAGDAPFTADEQELVLALGQQAAIAWERAALAAAEAQRLRLENELALGRRIQIGLLPHSLPQPSGWELAAAYEPARHVGGDFYDAFPVRGRRGSIALVIADVTGKGIPAALMMAFARPLLRSAADLAHGPAETLERANRLLVHDRPASQFVTAFHAVLDPRTGVLTWANAGHEPPLVVPAAGGRVRRLRGRGMLLGASSAAVYSEHRTRIGPGDLVLAFTDGVTDARRADGERYGEARLLRAVHRLTGGSAREAADGVLQAVHRFQGSEPAADDVALLAVRRNR